MLMSSSSVPLSTPEDQDGAKETPQIRYVSRRGMLGLMGSTAIAVTLAGCGGEQSGSSSSPSTATAETTFASSSTPEGPLSVSGAPNLPDGFSDTFTSRYVDTDELRQHAVIGGDGPPLLLVHGWPENWYAWRLVMPELARDFEVIAVDQQQALAPRLQPGQRPDNRTARQGTRGRLLRLRVRHPGRPEGPARRCPQVLLRPLLRPRRPARQFRVVPRVGHHPCTERGAQEPAAS